MGAGGGGDRRPPKVVHVPLVFVPGMKGTHLAFAGNDSPGVRKKRVWLTLGNLLNFPPRPDDDPSRDLSLPLTYDRDPPPEKGEDGHERASRYPRQHRGELVPDGIVDHIIEFNVGGGDGTGNFVDMNFLPFYGHAVSAGNCSLSKCARSQCVLQLILAMFVILADRFTPPRRRLERSGTWTANITRGSTTVRDPPYRTMRMQKLAQRR
jgi:hypothetical protein